MTTEKAALHMLAARCRQELATAIEEAVHETSAKLEWTWEFHDVLEALFQGKVVNDLNSNWWRWHAGHLELSFDREPWSQRNAWSYLGEAIERRKRLFVRESKDYRTVVDP